MKNIRELEIEMGKMFDMLMADPRRCAQAKEIANFAGKFINAQKVSIDYMNVHGKKQILPFMERTSKENK